MTDERLKMSDTVHCHGCGIEIHPNVIGETVAHFNCTTCGASFTTTVDGEEYVRRYVVSINVTVNATDEDEAHAFVATALGGVFEEASIVDTFAEDIGAR